MSFSTMVADRTVGKYPLSVATSLAIESCTGVHDELQYEHPPIQDYSEFWVNIRTLYRNLMGSLDTKGQQRAIPDILSETLSSEMEQINGIVKEINPNIKIVYYVSNYAGMGSKYRHAVLRGDRTEKQKEYTALQTITLTHLLKVHGAGILRFDLKIKPEAGSGKALMLTHFAYDLLSRKGFTDLDVLESHTGKIKPYTQWVTKYYNGKDLPPGMPFREDLLQVFGDKEHFVPMSREFREIVIDLATKYNWTPLTTSAKIRYGFESVKNPYAKDVLLDILKS